MIQESPLNETFNKSYSYKESKVVLLGVPWEVSVYIGGTVHGPFAIEKISRELDFFDPQSKKNPYFEGIHFLTLNSLKEKNEILRPLAKKVIFNNDPSPLNELNQACSKMVNTVAMETRKILDDGKIFGLIGGDHSVAEGSILEISRRYPNDLGLLHLDAHADMRNSYQGFKHSHASVMRNVIENKYSPKVVVQVGIRDLCEQEYEFMQAHSHVHCFFDYEIKNHLFQGKPWNEITHSMIKLLPNNVYISLDVDALTWSYAPHTGYPVPGGLTYDQVLFLFTELNKAGKKIVGFDVNEVACQAALDGFNEWNAIVGARLVNKLCGLSLFQ